jgi:YgiT-type zinc finger domain-containing protein
MECFYCKGELVRGTVSYTANRQGYHLIIDDVPAWVCKQCNEPLFEEETVTTIQHSLQEVDNQIRKLAIPVPV